MLLFNALIQSSDLLLDDLQLLFGRRRDFLDTRLLERLNGFG